MSPMSYYQRPFSPSAYSLPGSLNSSIIMPHGRSLGKSLDSCDFHDSFKIASTNHMRKIESTQVIFKKEAEAFNTPLFNARVLGKELGTVRIQRRKKRAPSYSKALRLLLYPTLEKAVWYLGGTFT